MPQKRSLLLWTPVFLAVAAIALTAVCQRLSTPPLPQTPEQLHKALTAVGLHYDARPVQLGGLLLRAVGNPASWEELEDALDHPVRFTAQPGHLFIKAEPPSFHTSRANPDRVQLGKLVLRGHPDELRKVFTAVAP
jgi:hypothetical protein